MIRKRTVFVLGAGASMPYGFPSGQQLRHDICTKSLMPGDPRHAILMQMGYSYGEVELCRNALARSWASSIDMFIAKRKDHADVAKAAIALTIASYERENDLFFADPKGDWFRYLWRHLLASSPKRLSVDTVSFITFNYDRSLEHALFQGLWHLHGKAPPLGPRLLPTIVHVYGSLGSYPLLRPKGPNARPFAAPSTPENTRRSVASIQVIADKQPDSSFPAQAQALLRAAEYVVFLGFGFDEDNLRNLRLLSEDSCLAGECWVYGTTLGLTPDERNHVVHLFGTTPNGRGRTNMGGESSVDCLMYLRQNVHLLQ